MVTSKERVIAMGLLCISAVAVSSAATAFDLVGESNAFLNASWRLQVTTIVQSVIQIKDWTQNTEGCLNLFRKYWHWVVISGVALSIHFSAWVLSLQMTTMSHSLFFVSTGNIIIVGYNLARCKNLSRNLLIGAAVGVVGMALVAFAPFTDLSGDVAGDFVAMLAALAVVIYLQIGENLQKWDAIPIFPYLVVVNGIAAIMSYVYAVIWNVGDASDIVAWLYHSYGVYTVYLGIVPGILGHAMFNYLLKIISPLIITIFMNLEPVIGSIIGWAFGFQAVPSYWTFVGGFLMIAGNMIVTIAEFKIKDQQEKERLLEEERSTPMSDMH